MILLFGWDCEKSKFAGLFETPFGTTTIFATTATEEPEAGFITDIWPALNFVPKKSMYKTRKIGKYKNPFIKITLSSIAHTQW